MATPRRFNSQNEIFQLYRSLFLKVYQLRESLELQFPSEAAAVKFRFGAYNEFRAIRNNPELDQELAKAIGDCAMTVSGTKFTLALRANDPMLKGLEEQLKALGIEPIQAIGGTAQATTAPPTFEPEFNAERFAQMLREQEERDAEVSSRPPNPYYKRNPDGSVQ